MVFFFSLPTHTYYTVLISRLVSSSTVDERLNKKEVIHRPIHPQLSFLPAWLEQHTERQGIQAAWAGCTQHWLQKHTRETRAPPLHCIRILTNGTCTLHRCKSIHFLPGKIGHV